MIERDFDVPFVARLAQREKQAQPFIRPYTRLHKWFARRPGSLFRALILAEFVDDRPLPVSYFQGHDLAPLIVGDPFMGGGTPLIEANQLGCHVVGTDINPMSYWIVRQVLTNLNLDAFQTAAKRVIRSVKALVGDLYETTCIYCGNNHAPVKHFLWVKVQPCAKCNRQVDLFMRYLIARKRGQPSAVFVCPKCGILNEAEHLDGAYCASCYARLVEEGPAGRRRCVCPHCGHENSYPDSTKGCPTHRLYAIEYSCPICKPDRIHIFKAPDERDLSRVVDAEERLKKLPQNYIPDDLIPPGDVSARLHSWGYQTYRQLFNARQLLGLQTLAAEIAGVEDESVRHALLTVFSDAIRYHNILCYYNVGGLRADDVFAMHNFTISTAQCENSLLGVFGKGQGVFPNLVRKYIHAKTYCEHPFEIYSDRPKQSISIPDETIGATLIANFPVGEVGRSAYLSATSADEIDLPAGSLDAVMTDPPYFANVQYAELMDFCYIWLRKHLGNSIPAFCSVSTRAEKELTVNKTEGRGAAHFTAGLSRIFTKFARALKPGAPFAFTYHYNTLDAYLPIAVAILDAGLVCTTTLPCPSEMRTSRHIHGKKASVVDTVFVCRTTGTLQVDRFEATSQNVKLLTTADLEDLQEAESAPTLEDTRCIIFGHMIRLAVWQLRSSWLDDVPFPDKLSRVESELRRIHPTDDVDRLAEDALSSMSEADVLVGMHAGRKRTRYDPAGQVTF